MAKPLIAFLIVMLLRQPVRTGLVAAVGLAQIGEFSFILAELGRTLGLLPTTGHSLLLTEALLSITLNPLLFRAIAPLEAWLQRHPRLARREGDDPRPRAEPQVRARPAPAAQSSKPDEA